MKKMLIASLMACTAVAAFGEKVHLSTPATSMVLEANEGDAPRFLYYGSKLSATDVDNIASTEWRQNLYPGYGFDEVARLTPVSVRHADGNMSLQLAVTGVEKKTVDGKEVTVIKTKDKFYPFYVDLNYMPLPGTDVIETWVEITNQEKKPVTLTRFASGYMPIRRGDVWISHLSGSWANEGRLTQEPLTPGVKTIWNKDGIRNTHTSHPEVMFSLDGKPNERTGNTIGAALCYTGNFEITVDTDDSESHRFMAGILPDDSEYHLKKGETFTTPALAYTYSKEGTSGVSRNFHKWGRKYRLHNGDKLRKILLNSWEGVYLDIKEPEMHQMMRDIASMGGELFVMDDGWFGEKYPRIKDNTALGDWKVDKNKLPHGLKALADTAEAQGIKFGIWIEPEMSNTVSELYDSHPEWIIQAPNREVRKGRGGTQVVLDLGNPEVQDFVVGVFDNICNEIPGLDYIKWDANCNVMSHGSSYLTGDEQSHLYINYHKGLENVLKRIREKHPDITVQDCASGGGRANWGMLPYFDEFWVSDNTDALQRIYMQWGTSYFFPAIAQASHISASPNHQTHRIVPLKYRADVAMSGRLGMEIQPQAMTEAERDLCRRAIADYKKIRPVVQLGDQYRLVSPYDNLGLASLMYVDDNKDNAAFFWYRMPAFCNQHLPRVKMDGLDPAKTYKVTELNRIDKNTMSFEGKTFSGEYLMSNGLEIPYNHDQTADLVSRVLYLQAQ